MSDSNGCHLGCRFRSDDERACANCIERDRARIVELESRLRYDCRGCPGCGDDDCPDMVDHLTGEVERLKALCNELVGDDAMPLGLGEGGAALDAEGGRVDDNKRIQ